MKVINQVSAGGIVYQKVKSQSFDYTQDDPERSRMDQKSKVKVLWLICQHSQHKGWVFPKGLVGDHTKDEPMENAALREVEEEGGIKAKIVNTSPVKVAYSYKWEGSLVNKTVYYFLMEYVSGDPKNHDWEMSESKFVTKEEIKKTLTYPSDKEAFEKILNILKTPKS